MRLTRPGRRFVTALALLFVSATAEAKELGGPSAGVVPYGMGRAYSAIADDWLSLYYNPAGLALVKKVDIQAFDLRLGTNSDVVKSVKSFKDVKSDKGVASILNSYAGKHEMADISNYSQITVPNFAVGMSYQINADIDLQNPSYPVTGMRYTKDFDINLGGAVGFGKQKDFRIGARLGFMHRTGGIRQIGIEEIMGNRKTLADSFTATGSGIAGDVGMQYRLPMAGQTEVTTSFVWHDIGDTSFGGHMEQNRPTRIDQNMTAGLGVRLPIGGRTNRRRERRYGIARSTSHLSFAFDYSYLNYSPDTEHLPKHIHLGMNLDLPILSVQVGLNQTSLTFGTGFDLGILRISAATYAEELGSYAGQRRDRRYLLSVGSGLGFKGF